jgi:hypothetical protein
MSRTCITQGERLRERSSGGTEAEVSGDFCASARKRQDLLWEIVSVPKSRSGQLKDRLAAADRGRMTGYAEVIPVNPSGPLVPACRQYVRNVNSAWGACTPAPLPAPRRSTHFKPLGILKSPHATTACGAPSRSSDLNGQGRPPLQGGEGLNVV